MRRALLLLLLALVVPRVASAQLFSPGKLSSAHADLEGLTNCTQCHPKGEKLSEDLCLDCHGELRERVAKRRGYHGRMPKAERACETCHHEHEGRDYPLIEWTPKDFDHRAAGYVLEGAHARTDCETCHDPRLIQDRGVRKLLTHAKKERTYLGLATDCVDCHFDEHRGQLAKDCAKCHGFEAFDPAPKFDHAKAEFPLRGKHRDVACEKCHLEETDTRTPEGAFPAPESRVFARYAPVEHDGCVSCHADPHDGRFGKDCARCHSEKGWRIIAASAFADRAFHAKTRYPLEGAHRRVGCEACHLPLGSRQKVYRGLDFARCDACHLDAHQGQVEGDCDACHDLEAFSVPRFSPADHAKTAYPLEGAHLAVACRRCHVPKDPAPAPSRSLARALARRNRAFLSSPAHLDLPARRCAECHADVHQGQLAHRVEADGCAGCHRVEGWDRVALDHDAQTRFALTGAHEAAVCESCHVRPEPGAPVRYRPVDDACASCHPDVHLGQLAGPDGRTDCARCHGTASFEVEGFDHGATRFPLTGRHEQVGCAGCHPSGAAGGLTVTRYRPLPTDCEGCHADFHEGGFDRFLTRTATVAAPGGCADCHVTDGWAPAAFDHARVGWALAGRHAESRCGACHGADLGAPRTRECASCHRDPHRGELGFRCASCHEQPSWESRFDAAAHQGTAFPLAGAHAVIPCEECHSDTFGRGFVRAAAGCVKCHADDYEATRMTGIDHVEAGFDTDCQRCHTPWRFEGARFDAHDACFSITGGVHAGITCLGCHESLQGAQVTGACDTRTARCTGCHEHRREDTDDEHDDVPGYQFEDRKCYECHRFAD